MAKFEKGKSGNPGGRPRELGKVRELAQAHTEVAINTLVQALSDAKLCVQAAQALLDRGWGKPNIPLTGAEGGPIEIITKAQRDAAVAAATRADS